MAPLEDQKGGVASVGRVTAVSLVLIVKLTHKDARYVCWVWTGLLSVEVEDHVATLALLGLQSDAAEPIHVGGLNVVVVDLPAYGQLEQVQAVLGLSDIGNV